MERSRINELISMPLPELQKRADKVRRLSAPSGIDLCTIFNAKSGRCPEDCKYCAQSVHYDTTVREYGLQSAEAILDAARRASDSPAGRFGIVTSGKKLGGSEIDLLSDAVRRITNELDIDVCLSLGSIDRSDLERLKDAGAGRYHHNLETSERFYPNIVTTHSYAQRVDTILNAKQAGFEVCSGGIFGLGETWQDRVDMALELEKLDVDSVPLNFLVPIPGTPLASIPALSAEEALRVICIYRIILRDKTIKVAAGRESVLGEAEEQIYLSGCNGMLVGGYLTIQGRPLEMDLTLVERVRSLWNGA